MCVIGAKYFKNTGWIGFKNRDRNYFASVEIRKELVGLEKLIIWDSITRWTEGINEKGISILSSCLNVKTDEDEINIARRKLIESGEYYSPNGQVIRKALSFQNFDSVIKCLIENNLTGHTLIFDAQTLYVLEGANQINPSDPEKKNYEYTIHKVAREKGFVVRSNHGILLPFAGYQDNEKHGKKRVSSEKRLDLVEKKLRVANSRKEIVDAFSSVSNKDKQLNPLRIDSFEKNMRTTGQIMLIPKFKELLYCPILGEMVIDTSVNKAKRTSFKTFENKVRNTHVKNKYELHFK